MKIGVCTILIGNPSYTPYTEKNHKSYCDTHGYGYRCFKEPLVDDVPIPFMKPEVILKMFDGGYDYVFYTDADSFFLNSDKKLECVIDAEYDFMCTGDQNDLCNAGHLIFKNSEWSKKFISMWVEFRCSISKKIIDKFKKITSHIFEDVSFGNLSDQIPLNVLLTSGKFSHEDEWFDIFSGINFYSRNKFRVHRDKSYAPHLKENLERANSLIFKDWQKNIKILEQRSMNSYLNNYSEDDLMIHLVSPKEKERVSVMFRKGILKGKL